MKHLTTLLLVCIALSVTAQHQARLNAAPTCNTCNTYIDVLRIGNDDDVTMKAIRIFPDATGYDLQIKGDLKITAKQVLATLAKANKYYTVIPGEMVRIEPAADSSLKQVYELVQTLLTGDYSIYFYNYTPRARVQKSEP